MENSGQRYPCIDISRSLIYATNTRRECFPSITSDTQRGIHVALIIDSASQDSSPQPQNHIKARTESDPRNLHIEMHRLHVVPSSPELLWSPASPGGAAMTGTPLLSVRAPIAPAPVSKTSVGGVGTGTPPWSSGLGPLEVPLFTALLPSPALSLPTIFLKRLTPS